MKYFSSKNKENPFRIESKFHEPHLDKKMAEVNFEILDQQEIQLSPRMAAFKSLKTQPDLRKSSDKTLETNRLKTPTYSSKFKERALKSVDKFKPFVTMMK